MITDARASMMFLLLRQGQSVAAIARKLKMSEKTIRKYRETQQLPSQVERPPRTYRTRPDPLGDFWEEIEALLEQDPHLKPYAILDWLKQKYNPPEGEPRVTDSLRRTLERRVQRWKLDQGVGQDVKFPQVHHAADVMAFDFVVMNALKVTIAGKPLDHMLFHAVLTYSNWEYVHLCYSESFEAVSAGLQDALHHAGGVPHRVRSDSLSAAVNNLSSDKEFARQYRELLEYYGVQGHRINVRKPHENGDVESSHGHFKDALDQALRLRGSRDFASIEDYVAFLGELARRRNTDRGQRFAEESAALNPLPPQRRPTCTSVSVTVKSDSVIRVKRNVYSVSSKYIGLKLEVRIHQDHLELWYQNDCLERMPRQFGRDKEAIDFRHVIDSLVRKPGAFINYKYVNHMYPTTRFRMAYDQLLKTTTEASAVKQYLKLLYAAKHEGLDFVDDVLRWFLTNGQKIRADEVLKHVTAKQQFPAATDVNVTTVDLSLFDSLLPHKDVYDAQETNHTETASNDLEDRNVEDRSVEDAGLADDHRSVEDENVSDAVGLVDHRNVDHRNTSTVTRLADDVDTCGATEGATASDVPRELLGNGRASGPRPMDAHAVPSGPCSEGMPSKEPESDYSFNASCESAGGQDLGPIRLVSPASACDATIRDASSGGLLESPRQRADLWETGLGENDVVIGVGRSTGEARPRGLVLDMPDVGSRIVASQAGSAVGTTDQEVEQVRSLDHRRLGVRSAEPRGDGSAVHVTGRTLRTGQCLSEFQSALFQVGADLQRPYDHGGGDRPFDSSFGDHRTEHPQLPTRSSQEEPSQTCGLKGWLKGVARVIFRRSF